MEQINQTSTEPGVSNDAYLAVVDIQGIDKLVASQLVQVITQYMPLFPTVADAQKSVEENPREDGMTPAFFRLSIERVSA